MAHDFQTLTVVKLAVSSSTGVVGGGVGGVG